MNWYKKAQQQYLWDNDPQLSNSNIDRNSVQISGDIEEDVENCKDITELQSVLFNYGIKDIDEVVFEKVKEKIWTFDYNGKLYLTDLSFPYPSFENAEEWVYNIGENAWQYVDYKDFGEDFWENVTEGETLYHGTYEDRIEDIMREGLSPMDKTRGIENRSTGSAIFTSSSAEVASEYYPIVLEINIGQMKADRYMPRVSKEGPVDESETLQALAYKIGLEDFYVDYEQGLDPETIIFYGNIPAKYLRIIG